MNLPRVAAISLAVIASVAPAGGQSGNCLERIIPLSIVSKDGSPLPNIGPSTFTGSTQGGAVKINSVILDLQPRRVLLLLDVSGSFDRMSDWHTDTALDLLDHIPPPNEVGVPIFSESIKLLAPPTTDRAQIREQIDSMFGHTSTQSTVKFKGRTSLWDSIRDGAKLLGSQRFGDVVFVISDGKDSKSKANAVEATSSLLAQGVRLFAVQVTDPRLDPERMVGFDPDNILAKLAYQTGGLAVVPERWNSSPPENGKIPGWLRRDLDLQYRQILYFYRIDLTLGQAVKKQEGLKLSLADSDKSARTNFELNYPKFISPCN
jgi:hypothetical protein